MAKTTARRAAVSDAETSQPPKLMSVTTTMSAVLPEPIEKFLRGDSFFSICLIKSIEKLGLFGWRKLDRGFFVARKDSDDGALGQGIPLDNDLSAYDGSGG